MQLALAAQVDQKTISNIERGDNCAQGSGVVLKNAAKVANALNIPLWELIRPPKRVAIAEKNTHTYRIESGRRIRAARGDLPEEELAETVGISTSSLYMYENGVQYISPDIAHKIAACTGKETAWIMALDNIEHAPEPLLSDWRDCLRACMKERGLSQEELAQQLGVSQGTISHWLTGKRQPESLEQYEALAKALLIHPADLLYGGSHIAIDALTPEQQHHVRLFVAALIQDDTGEQ